MVARYFDYHVRDKAHAVRIDVTHTEQNDFVQINVVPLRDLWPRTTVCISTAAAAELAHALLAAIHGEDEDQVTLRATMETMTTFT